MGASAQQPQVIGTHIRPSDCPVPPYIGTGLLLAQNRVLLTTRIARKSPPDHSPFVPCYDTRPPSAVAPEWNTRNRD